MKTVAYVTLMVFALTAPACGGGGERERAVAAVAFDVSDGESAASDFAWSPDGRHIAVLSRLLRKVSVFDARTGTLVGHLENLAGGASSIGFDRAGDVVSGPSEGPAFAATLWNVESGAKRSLPGVDGSTTDPSGNMLLEFSIDQQSDRLLGVYQLPQGSAARTALALYDLGTGALLKKGGPAALHVALARGGRVAAFRIQGGALSLFDVERGEQLRTIYAHASGVDATAWHPAGRIVATGGKARAMVRDPQSGTVHLVQDPQTLKMWNAETGEMIGAAALPQAVEMISFSSDGKLLAASDGFGVVHILDATQPGRVLATIPPPERQSVVVRISPDGRNVARLITAPSRIEIGDVPAAPSGAGSAAR